MPDAVRTATLIGLLGLGYADRIFLSHDFIGCGMGRGGAMPEDDRKLLANWSYTHIFRKSSLPSKRPESPTSR